MTHCEELAGNMETGLLLVSGFLCLFLLSLKEVVTERPGSGIWGSAREQEAPSVSCTSCFSGQQGRVIVLRACAPLQGYL